MKIKMLILIDNFYKYFVVFILVYFLYENKMLFLIDNFYKYLFVIF